MDCARKATNAMCPVAPYLGVASPTPRATMAYDGASRKGGAMQTGLLVDIAVVGRPARGILQCHMSECGWQPQRPMRCECSEQRD